MASDGSAGNLLVMLGESAVREGELLEGSVFDPEPFFTFSKIITRIRVKIGAVTFVICNLFLDAVEEGWLLLLDVVTGNISSLVSGILHFPPVLRVVQ